MRHFSILQGDVLAVLRTLPDESFHACLCDPPYGLSFMGKAWDHGVPVAEVWAEVLRVLKPGAPLLAFGGTRTFHRLTCAIEDAGFEIRDCLMWLYGSGFPKSMDIGKALDKRAGAEREVLGKRSDGRYKYDFSEQAKRAMGDVAHAESQGFTGTMGAITAPSTPAAKLWDGYGTALKPAWEPIILAMKPLGGTFAENALKHGVAGLNIDGCRIGATERPLREARRNQESDERRNAYSQGLAGSKAIGVTDLGRWPANVILDEAAAAMLDEQSGESKSSGHTRHNGDFKSVAKGQDLAHETTGVVDSGGTSRFFYCAKADRLERDAGLHDLPPRPVAEKEGRNSSINSGMRIENGVVTGPKANSSAARNFHPTVKPIDLCAYLAKLILPPVEGTRLLVPFSGSGSEIMGALRSGWAECVGIEREAEYVALSRRRIEGDAPIFNSETKPVMDFGPPDPPIPQNGELFGRVLGEIDAAKEMALTSAPKGAE